MPDSPPSKLPPRSRSPDSGADFKPQLHNHPTGMRHSIDGLHRMLIGTMRKRLVANGALKPGGRRVPSARVSLLYLQATEKVRRQVGKNLRRLPDDAGKKSIQRDMQHLRTRLEQYKVALARMKPSDDTPADAMGLWVSQRSSTPLKPGHGPDILGPYTIDNMIGAAETARTALQMAIIPDLLDAVIALPLTAWTAAAKTYESISEGPSWLMWGALTALGVVGLGVVTYAYARGSSR